jgi:beta-galactosidase
MSSSTDAASLDRIAGWSKRQTISLDGTWQVGESKARHDQPASYGHQAPVPGLLSSAQPPFPDVGKFASREFQYNGSLVGLISGGLVQVPIDEAAKAETSGISYQGRDYFWYRRQFQAPAAREHALLAVLKAQFGSEVWLNGTKVGERDGCFTAGTYDISEVIRWGAQNEVVVRVGAHPGVLPEGNACNIDFEKEFWYPGIWDSVELHCFDGPAIQSIQIAPRLNPREILVEAIVENLSSTPDEVTLNNQVRDSDGRIVLREHRETIQLAPLERVTHRFTIPLPSAETWSPDSPTLYWLETSTPGDTVLTRFGMREFRFDTFTKRAYLNGEPIFLRGCGVALHRFFEDPLCGTLPWNEQWVRKLLGDGPKTMHWNMLKFTIGPVPRKWFDLADELGLLVVYEFPIWTLSPEIFFGYEKHFDRAVLKQEMSAWLRDNWNHPSIIYWNTNLESYQPWLAEEILPEVRALDLSNRAWGDGWCPPPGPDDPMEDHPYEFSANGIAGRPNFDMIQLEARGGFERPHLGSTPSGHASVIAEYGWLWLTRDGNPTLLTRAVYPTLPYPTETPQERIETACYLIGGLTEYWRSFRHHTGVGFYGYLAGSGPQPYTSDYFADVEKLQLHPAFEDYVGEAFKPLGVYLNFWRRELKSGTEQELFVMMCNDEAEVRSGELIITLEAGEKVVELGRKPFSLGRLGQQTLRFHVQLPEQTGAFTLRATAKRADGGETVSRRWVTLQEEAIQQQTEPGAEPQFGQAFSD